MLGFYQDVWEICFVIGPYRQLCSAHVKKCGSLHPAKRWMWSHLFSGAIFDEVVELLVVDFFCKMISEWSSLLSSDRLPKVCF